LKTEIFYARYAFASRTHVLKCFDLYFYSKVLASYDSLIFHTHRIIATWKGCKYAFLY